MTLPIPYFLGCFPQIPTPMVQNVDPTHLGYIPRTPDAVTAKRLPQRGKRSQDASPTSNVGKTYVTENNAQPSQPNPSSLRQ